MARKQQQLTISISMIINDTDYFGNSYLCNQLRNALFCVTTGIFAGRSQRDPVKSHELYKIAFPNVLHTRFFSNFDKKKVSSNVKRTNINKLLLC
jgi:hypothetical protein